MKLTTETVLTHPKAFGLTTATPLQRAFCRMLDGLPLGDLAERDDVREAFGGVEAVAALPVGAPPHEVQELAAIRTAKSMGASARIVTMSQSVDVSGTSVGDIIRILVAALKLEGTRPIMAHLIENCRAKPLLRPLLVGEPSETGVSLRHPSGRIIEVCPIPIDRAGGSALSTYSAGVVIDEAPRMLGAADGVKNWDDTRRAAIGRILPGGQFLSIGSPWAPFGPIFDRTQEYFGKPSGDLVVFRAAGPVMNPAWWTPERCANLLRRDPIAYRTDCEAQFADPITSLIAQVALDSCTRDAPSELPPGGAKHVAAIDPGSRSNAFALIIIRIDEREGKPWYRVACVREWRGTKGDPLDLRATLAEVAREAARYGITSVATDQWSSDALRELAEPFGIHLPQRTATSKSNFENFDTLRTAIATSEIEIPRHPTLRQDLLGLRRRVTQAGVVIEAARTSDGRHSDLASALALALAEARQGGGWGDLEAVFDACVVTNRQFSDPSDPRYPRGGGDDDDWDDPGMQVGRVTENAQQIAALTGRR